MVIAPGRIVHIGEWSSDSETLVIRLLEDSEPINYLHWATGVMFTPDGNSLLCWTSSEVLLWDVTNTAEFVLVSWANQHHERSQIAYDAHFCSPEHQ